MQIGSGYATRTYRLAADVVDGNLAVLDAAIPRIHGPGPRNGLRATGGCSRWRHLGDHPPTDPDGFLDFARSLRFPDIYRPSLARSRWMPRSAFASRPACVTATNEGTDSPPA